VLVPELHAAASNDVDLTSHQRDSTTEIRSALVKQLREQTRVTESQQQHLGGPLEADAMKPLLQWSETSLAPGDEGQCPFVNPLVEVAASDHCKQMEPCSAVSELLGRHMDTASPVDLDMKFDEKLDETVSQYCRTQ